MDNDRPSHDDPGEPAAPVSVPIVGRGTSGEIVILDHPFAASLSDGQWSRGVGFDGILKFTAITDPSEVRDLIDAAKRATVA